MEDIVMVVGFIFAALVLPCAAYWILRAVRPSRWKKDKEIKPVPKGVYPSPDLYR